MRRILLGLLILGAIASLPLLLGATSRSSADAGPMQAAEATAVRYTLRLIDTPTSAPRSDALIDAETQPSTAIRAKEGYELTISYRDSAGNAFTLIKPMDGGPASIEGRFSPGFWEQKLEPLLRSVAALFTISVER